MGTIVTITITITTITTITSTQPPLIGGVPGQPKGGAAAQHNTPLAITIAINNNKHSKLFTTLTGFKYIYP